MNDAHDAFGMPFEWPDYPLKADHPELLLGSREDKGSGPQDGLRAAMWSGLDYAHPTVREDRLWWVRHAARSYPLLAGVELNFFRMPAYFAVGTERANAHLLTQLVRDARAILDAESRERRKPVLLSVRVPDTVEACWAIGIDVTTWLSEGLVDRVLSGGGYVCYSTPARELIELGHAHQ